MDSFEMNKIAGATLAALLVVLGVNIGSNMAFRPVKPAKQAYVVAGVVEEASAEAAPAAEAEQPIAVYLAAADPAKGEAVFKKCGACHNNEKGGSNGIGPNLYGIVGMPHDHAAGFAYSEALMAMKGKPWTWDELNLWLKSPKAYAPGTKMAFAGVSKPQDRANLLAYLNSKSDAPMAMPAAPAAAEATPAAAEPAPTADGPAA